MVSPTIWRFPKIGLPSDHPFIDGFAVKKHQFLDTNVLGNPHAPPFFDIPPVAEMPPFFHR